MVVFILSAVDPRMTIHHFGGGGKQGRSSPFRKKDSMAAAVRVADRPVFI
jgi:hypothetical protein